MANGRLVRPLALGTVTAEGSGAGTLPGYLGNDYIGVVHRGSSTSDAWVQLDLGGVQSVDFAAFLSLQAGAATTQRVRAASSAGALTGTPGYDSTAIALFAGSAAPESGRQNSWWEPSASQSFRYWRFDIPSLGGTAFEAGRLVIGSQINFARNFSFGAVRGVRDRGKLDFSTSGNVLRRYGRKLRTLQLTYSAATKAEIETQVLPLFEGVGNTDCLLAIVDPAADTQRSRRMYYGPLEGDLSAVWRTADGFEWRAQLVSLI